MYEPILVLMTSPYRPAGRRKEGGGRMYEPILVLTSSPYRPAECLTCGSIGVKRYYKGVNRLFPAECLTCGIDVR